MDKETRMAIKGLVELVEILIENDLKTDAELKSYCVSTIANLKNSLPKGEVDGE